MENLSFSKTLKDIKILIMSYSNMKPMDKAAHDQIAAWVKQGGILVYCGRDDDAFQSVQEWWNTGTNKFNAPADHLFMKLGLKEPFKAGEYKVNKGKVCIMRNDPKEFVLKENNDNEYINLVRKLYETDAKGGVLKFKNHFTLTRGPYELISVVNENANQSPYVVSGKLIDLFDPEIPVLGEKTVSPGEQAFLYNINSVKNPKTPQVLATAARIYNENITKNIYTFVARSPLNTTNVMRMLLPEAPHDITVTDATGKLLASKTSWDVTSKTCFLSFENNPDGVYVKIIW
jgi:hypothetical protein